jgi:glutamate/aspartate transport system ATP-binding protein
MAMIDIKDVSKWYGSFQVLTDCTTNVSKGEVVVVCGPSGSGKSTLIKTVNGLEPFQKGTISVDGVPVNDPKTNLSKLRSRIGMVFQNFELFPHSRWSATSRSRRSRSWDAPKSNPATRASSSWIASD